MAFLVATPDKLTLGGAFCRRYGTNAVAARTNLTTTKDWTIISDAPSGVACPAPLPIELLALPYPGKTASS